MKQVATMESLLLDPDRDGKVEHSDRSPEMVIVAATESRGREGNAEETPSGIRVVGYAAPRAPREEEGHRQKEKEREREKQRRGRERERARAREVARPPFSHAALAVEWQKKRGGPA